MATRTEVNDAIDGERDYQEGWRDPSLTTSGGVHNPHEFLTYIEDYAREAIHVGCRRPDPEATEFQLHALRKIAALAVAAMEQNGVRTRSPEDVLAQRHR